MLGELSPGEEEEWGGQTWIRGGRSKVEVQELNNPRGVVWWMLTAFPSAGLAAKLSVFLPLVLLDLASSRTF